LVELSLVLAVASTIIGAIWGAGVLVKNKAYATNAISEIQTVAQNMVDYGKSGYGYGGTPAVGTNITSTMLNTNTGVIPSWAVTSGAANHPWSQGGFYMWWVSSNPSRMFRISLYGVDSVGDCVAVILGAVSCTTPQSGCVYQVYTGGTLHTFTAVASGHAASSVTSNNAYTWCNTPNNNYTGGAVNSVEFDYYM
jgi:hypothetical protein